jgi:hypothetical protein
MSKGDQVMVTLRRPNRTGHILTEAGTISGFSTTGAMALVTINRTGEIVGRYLMDLESI